ncbi:MAG: hypothetical protein MH137_13520 [Flavobacteriales bacterium]|nr:hypothetical protein [Flavobacteriales bacterium]
MIKGLSLRYIQYGILVLVGVVSLYLSLHKASKEVRPIVSYDEKNWTGVSISTYHMFFKGYVRQNVKMDSWYTTYALENGLDTAAMSVEQKQWYDFAMWTFGWKAPNVGKFIMGAYVNSTSGQELDKSGYYELGKTELGEDPKIYHSRVPEELIYIARKPNAILNALGICVIFITGWLFLNWWAGFLASLYLMANEVYTVVNSSAGLDSPSIFFWSLAVLFLGLTLRSVFRAEALWKVLLWGLGTGIVFGLAVGSKLNAAMFGYVCMFIFSGAALVIFFQKKNTEDKTVPFLKSLRVKKLLLLGLSGLIIAVSGPVLFVKLNPQVQGDTLTKVKIIRLSVDEFFKRRANSQISKNRQARKTLIEVTFKKPEKAFSLITRRNFVVDDTERYYGTLGSLLPFKGNIMDGLLLLVGLLAMLWLGVKNIYKNQMVGGEWVVLVSFFVMLYGMAHFIWIDFSRYHMAIYPGMALAIGYGLFVIGSNLFSLTTKNRKGAQ